MSVQGNRVPVHVAYIEVVPMSLIIIQWNCYEYVAGQYYCMGGLFSNANLWLTHRESLFSGVSLNDIPGGFEDWRQEAFEDDGYIPSLHRLHSSLVRRGGSFPDAAEHDALRAVFWGDLR